MQKPKGKLKQEAGSSHRSASVCVMARHTGTVAANMKAVYLKLIVVFWDDSVFKNENVMF